MKETVCIITGANAGIGMQAAIQIANAGAHVVLACRSEERGKKALDTIRQSIAKGSVELKLVDMSSLASVKSFAQDVNACFPQVDILIHNAADFDITRKKAQFSQEGIETVWAANHVGPVLLTELLLDALKRSEEGRVITISSKGLLVKPYAKVSLDDPEFKKRKYSVSSAYYQSKRAQEMYTVWLSQKLRGTSVTANCIRVTNVKVDISRYPGLSAIARLMYQLKSKAFITPQQMARTYAYLAMSDEVKGISGKCFDEKNKMMSFNGYTADPASIDAVMNVTMRYISQ